MIYLSPCWTANCLTCHQCSLGVFGTCLISSETTCQNSTESCYNGEARKLTHPHTTKSRGHEATIGNYTVQSEANRNTYRQHCAQGHLTKMRLCNLMETQYLVVRFLLPEAEQQRSMLHSILVSQDILVKERGKWRKIQWEPKTSQSDNVAVSNAAKSKAHFQLVSCLSMQSLTPQGYSSCRSAAAWTQISAAKPWPGLFWLPATPAPSRVARQTSVTLPPLSSCLSSLLYSLPSSHPCGPCRTSPDLLTPMSTLLLLFNLKLTI